MSGSYFENARVRQGLAILAIVVTGGFLLVSLSNFIIAALGAVILYITTRPFMRWLCEKKKLGRNLSASIVLITSFVVILLPTLALSYMLVKKLSGIVVNSDEIMVGIKQLEVFVHDYTGFDLFSDDTLLQVQQQAAGMLTGVLGGTLKTLGDVAIMYFMLFFMLTATGDLEKRMLRFIPFSESTGSLFAEELVSQTYSNVFGAPLLAIIQGFVAALGYWIFGMEDPVFWGIMTGFFSFIPFVGSSLIWAPIGVYLLSQGMTWQGLACLAYGIVVVVNIDNVTRFILQKKFADVHPLITVLGVLFGLDWFGLPGIIFGPLLISYFLLMIQVYRKEYTERHIISIDESEQGTPPTE